jgi:hypothetical protein
VPLAEGEASGVTGQYTVQAQLTIDNSFAATPTACTLTVLVINSGFLVTERGQSRIVRGPISAADVLAAPIVGTHEDLKRMIGSGVADRFSNALSKGKDWMSGVAASVKDLPKAVAATKQFASDLAHRIM